MRSATGACGQVYRREHEGTLHLNLVWLSILETARQHQIGLEGGVMTFARLRYQRKDAFSAARELIEAYHYFLVVCYMARNYTWCCSGDRKQMGELTRREERGANYERQEERVTKAEVG